MIDKSITVLGSTGSVGIQTLDVAEFNNIKINGLSADKNIEMLEMQVRRFKPVMCAVNDEVRAGELKIKLADTDVKVLGGAAGIEELAYENRSDLVYNSILGIAGLKPTLAAVRNKKNIALANKETLVTAGNIVMREAELNGVKIIPVDSEHSAIFQALDGNPVKKILLTCSGGPFFGYDKIMLKDVTLEKALAHPKWNMGAKISVDSATLMNKGLEVIEAVRLFGVSPKNVEVIIHRESIIHSMVEYIDNVVIAQMGLPDMRTCIQYALTYPERRVSQTDEIDFFSLAELTFNKPDYETFPLLSLAYKAIETNGIMPVVLNAANEFAVDLFLREKIRFTEISELVGYMMENSVNIIDPTIDDILNTDLTVREDMKKFLKGRI